MLTEILSGIILFIIFLLLFGVVLVISLVTFLGVYEKTPNLLRIVFLPLILVDKIILKTLFLLLVTPIFIVCLDFKNLKATWEKELDIMAGIETLKSEVK